MKEKVQRVSLAFTSGSNHEVETVAVAVGGKLFGNTKFPEPPVDKVTLETATKDFTTANAEAAVGGPSDTANRDGKRDVLVNLLKVLAAYVQTESANDLAVLLSSGFTAMSTNRSQSQLPTPELGKIKNGMSGQLLISVKAITNARCYELRYALIAADGAVGPYQSGGIYTSSRNMPLNLLTPGSRYAVQVRAVGGSTGYSDWSDPASHMSL